MEYMATFATAFRVTFPPSGNMRKWNTVIDIRETREQSIALTENRRVPMVREHENRGS